MLLPALLATALAQAPSGLETAKARARETAYARIALARRIAGDAVLLEAVAAKNKAGETLQQVRAKDQQWTGDPRYPLRRELTAGRCAERLRELVAEDSFVVEAMLMDAQGAVVCSSVETQDYWQGDEAKWIATFEQGKELHVDEPKLDANTNRFAVQLSTLVVRSGARLGALTLTLKLPRDEKAAGPR
jgi:hypothetical protein